MKKMYVLIGNYGSGKSELALNFAFEAAKHGRTKAQAIGELIAEYRPRKAAMAGDRLGDIESGLANALPTAAACYGYGFPEEWQKATAQVKTVEELGDVLMGWIA